MEDAPKSYLGTDSNVLVNIKPFDAEIGKTVSFVNMTFSKASNGTKRKLSSPRIDGCMKKHNLDKEAQVDAAKFFSQFDPYIKINPDLDRTWFPGTDDLTVNVTLNDTDSDGNCEETAENTTQDSDGNYEETAENTTQDDKTKKCMNCDLGAVVVAWCDQCLEDPYLCEGCVEAHKRVRLTRGHHISFDQPFLSLEIALGDQTDENQMFQNVLDAIDPARDLKNDDGFYAWKTVKQTIGVLVRKAQLVPLAGNNSNILPECVIADNLLALLNGGSVEVKARTALVIDRLVKVNLVNPSIFCDERGIKGFQNLLSYRDVELLDPGLSSVQQLVIALVKIDACFSLGKLSNGLVDLLEVIQDSEFSFQSSRLGASDSFGRCNQLYLDENHLHCPLYGCNPECLKKRASDILTKLESRYR